jgi:hypothetical protein
VSEEADQVSAFGQEPWAQCELRKLRREYPDWAFLVVQYCWQALRGKYTVIVAAGPDALRTMLPTTTGPRPAAVDRPAVGASAVAQPGQAGLSGPGMGVLPARLSGTGTWAVVPHSARRTGWWSRRWPWSRRRARHGRKRTESREQLVRGRPRAGGQFPLAVG